MGRDGVGWCRVGGTGGMGWMVRDGGVGGMAEMGRMGGMGRDFVRRVGGTSNRPNLVLSFAVDFGTISGPLNN